MDPHQSIASSPRFREAARYARDLHSGQKRKGTDIPYFTHVEEVARLVLEHGGDEDQGIAALLHDGPEDAGGEQALEEIRSRFGERVAKIVEHCSDTFEELKPEWWTRKRDYHQKLREASAGTLLVSVADKVHNAESTLEDLRANGPDVWNRFKTGREGTLWNYARLLEVVRERTTGPCVGLVNRLEVALDGLSGSEDQKLLARFFDPSSLPSTGEPELWIVMGPVCTGKSRFIRKRFRSDYVHVDAARVFLGLSRDAILPFPGDFEDKLEKIGRAVAARAVAERRNILVEVIGHEDSPFQAMIDGLSACGYSRRVDLVECDVDLAIERNQRRGDNNISAYFAEPYHYRWLSEAAAVVESHGGGQKSSPGGPAQRASRGLT